MRAISRSILILLLMLPGVPALAHETDQFTVPPQRQFADLGEYFNRWAYQAIERGVDATNRRIRQAIAQDDDAHVLAELESAPHVTMAVRQQWPWSVTQIETFEQVLASAHMRHHYPGRVVSWGNRFGGEYRYAFFPLDVRQFAHLLFFSSTIKVFGTYMGTDKLGHFTDEGIDYYFAYRSARDRGASERQAIAAAVRLGTDGFMSERGVLGLLANGDYSNGDLSGNFAGFLFYRNLAEPVIIKGVLRQPLLRRDGPCWVLADDVRPESGFFARFISDHLDEALNPGYFDDYLRPGLRDALRQDAGVILEHYCDEHGRPRTREWFDSKLRELSTYWGMDYGHLGTYPELVSIGNSCFDREHGAMHLAAESRDAKLPLSLLKPRDDEAVRSRFGESPLHVAAAAREGRRVKDLLVSHANARARDAFGRTPLHEAARAGAVEAARALLDHGTDPKVADDYGVTPLHLACRRDLAEMVRLLLDHGADVNARSASGATPLHEAALTGDDRLVWMLLDRGADPGARDARGRRAVDVAAEHGNRSTVDFLARAHGFARGGGR